MELLHKMTSLKMLNSWKFGKGLNLAVVGLFLYHITIFVFLAVFLIIGCTYAVQVRKVSLQHATLSVAPLMWAGVSEPIQQVRRSPDQPARVVSCRKLVLSSSSFCKVEKALYKVEGVLTTNAFWACTVQYKVLGYDVMTMNIIKMQIFAVCLARHSPLPAQLQIASTSPDGVVHKKIN